MAEVTPIAETPRDLRARLERQDYFADIGLATAIYLATALGKPLLLEGEPGVGKTEAARALAAVAGRELVRLQCYEGLDAAQALYEWNYQKQLLAMRSGGDTTSIAEIYTPDFLLERPLLKALRQPEGTVVLIDEIDRADAEFEAFLLEFLGEFQISIPEIGTVAAEVPPIAILTSNRTRELHGALKRRCAYHWIDLPSAAHERKIIDARAPGLSEEAATALIDAVRKVRRLPLTRRPGIAEGIEWARGAMSLERAGLSWPVALRQSLGLLAKDQDDCAEVEAALSDLLGTDAA